MEHNKHKCKLCGLHYGLNDTPEERWCEDCRGGMELITYLRDNLLPINEETILNNIDRFMTDSNVERFIHNSDGMEKYLDLNYSIEQYEKIKLRSDRIRKKLKLI